MKSEGKQKKEEYLPVVVPVFILSATFIISALLMPKNCDFFEGQPGPFMCDAIPNDCCKFGYGFLFSHAVLCTGIALTIGMVIYYIRLNLPGKPDQLPKLFD